jgi:hypothetical protein
MTEAPASAKRSMFAWVVYILENRVRNLITWENLDGPEGIGRGMARCDVALVRKAKDAMLVVAASIPRGGTSSGVPRRGALPRG